MNCRFSSNTKTITGRGQIECTTLIKFKNKLKKKQLYPETYNKKRETYFLKELLSIMKVVM